MTSMHCYILARYDTWLQARGYDTIATKIDFILSDISDTNHMFYIGNYLFLLCILTAFQIMALF